MLGCVPSYMCFTFVGVYRIPHKWFSIKHTSDKHQRILRIEYHFLTAIALHHCFPTDNPILRYYRLYFLVKLFCVF